MSSYAFTEYIDENSNKSLFVPLNDLFIVGLNEHYNVKIKGQF